jgi:hypothetical protein
MPHIDIRTGSRSVRGNQQPSWRHNGAGQLWLVGQRHLGCVSPDPEQVGMWRVQWSDGCISDLTNLTRAKDALSRFAETKARKLRGVADTIRRPPMRPAGKAASNYGGAS